MVLVSSKNTIRGAELGLLKLQMLLNVVYLQSKEEGKDQESIQSSTTPDQVHHMGK